MLTSRKVHLGVKKNLRAPGSWMLGPQMTPWSSIACHPGLLDCTVMWENNGLHFVVDVGLLSLAPAAELAVQFTWQDPRGTGALGR